MSHIHTIASLLGALHPVIQEQAATETRLRDEIADLVDQNLALHREVSDKNNTIARLGHTIDELDAQVETLSHKNQDLQQPTYKSHSGEIATYLRNIPQLQAVLAYMAKEGVDLLRQGAPNSSKVPVIKGVRNASEFYYYPPWGLKESKDFVEAYPLTQWDDLDPSTTGVNVITPPETDTDSEDAVAERTASPFPAAPTYDFPEF